MTAQYHDKLIFKKNEYDIIGIDGADLPTPQAFGITPEGEFHTGCYRGYYAQYEIIKDRLFLNEILINITSL